MNAQLIYKLLDQINKYGTRIESDMVSENLKLIGEIYALAGAVVPCDAYRNGNDRKFWLSADRGSFDGFVETYYSGEKSRNETDIEKMKKEWSILFPEEKVWFCLYLASYKGDRGIWLDNRCIYSTIKKEYYLEWAEETVDASPLLIWIIQEIKNCLDMIKAGTYNDYICDNLPYKHRSGIVKMNTYWKYIPKDKERLFSGIDEKELEEFLDWKQDETPGFKSMSVKDYLKACDSLYDLLGIKEKYPIRESDNSFRAEYRAYAANYNSADKFLSLDEESPDAFDKFVSSDKNYDHHIWEVCLAPRVHLYPQKEKGEYYLYLESYHNEEYSFIIHLVLEMKKMGYPMIKPQFIEEKQSGEELIRIIPYGDNFDSRYAFHHGISTTDRRMLPRKYSEELIKKIEWFPITTRWEMKYFYFII